MSRTVRVRRRVPEVLLTLGATVGALSLLVAVLCLVLDLRLLTFRSGSMSPTIGTGALAVARSTDAADLRRGDVVSVRTGDGDRVTHRVVAVEPRGDRVSLELRGDASTASDAAPYLVERADRVLFSVPLLGYAGALLVSPPGLLLLGGYLCVLLRILLRRDPAAAPRHRSRPAVPALVALVLLGTATAASSGVLAGRSAPTLAAWTDAVTPVTAGTVSTATVPAPVGFSCGLLGFLSVSFSWTAVPGATSYTVHFGSGGAQTTTVTGTSATITAAIAGGQAWVTANRSFGSTTWTSAASGTRSYTVAVLSLCS